MNEGAVHVDVQGNVAAVTLARPEKLNALTPEMIDRLAKAAIELDADKGIRAVVLTARGERAFCVGADIKCWSELQPLDMWRRWVRDGHAVFERLARLRQPLIAAVDGLCLGGGLELAATADIRIASEAASFGLPEATIGTTPGWSGTQRVVDLIGPSRAKLLVFSGDAIEAREALRIGLVDRVVEAGEAYSAAMVLAQRIAKRAPVSVQVSKQLINAARGVDTAATLESLAGALTAMTEDGREGIASFLDKRIPTYRGE